VAAGPVSERRPAGEDRLKRRLLTGAVDDNVRAIRNEPRRKLHRRAPVVRWLVPGGVALAAAAVAAWALFLKPPEAAKVVYATVAASGPASTPFGSTDTLDLPDGAALPRDLTRMPSQVFPLAVRRIVLDPGHGGTDEGTKTPNGLTEKILTLDVAQRLALKLIAAGFDVSLTREDDRRLYLRDRVRYANQLQADLFVSIHVNWFKDGRQNRGIETYYLGPSDDPYVTALASAENRESGYALADVRKLLDSIYSDLRQQESRRLAGAVQKSLLAAARTASPDVRDRGVRSAPFLVLVETGMPAILAEVASLSNAEEARLLTNEEYRERIATALYDGIRAYSGVHEGTGSVERQR
jgi:N-acetylmuramoyl-L-alanine amidase